MDKSLLIGAILFGFAILGGVFHFVKTGLFSMGLNQSQSKIAAGLIVLLTMVFVWKKVSWFW